MPLFEYECEECNARFEKLVYESGAEITCRQCGSAKVKQLLSVFAVSSSSQGKAAADSGQCCGCSPEQRAICQN